jgi:hypothetical protein
MDPILDQVEKIIPPRYMPWIVLMLWVVPYLTRSYAALKNGHGIIGIVRAILWGDPKPLAIVKEADDSDTQIFRKEQTPPAAAAHDPILPK